MADRRSSFTVDVRQLARAAERLASVDDAMLDKSMVGELNKIVDETFDDARGRMSAGINVTDAYMRSKMDVVHATPERGLRAEIIARGGRGDQSPLGRYFTGQATAPAPRAKGDPARGIAPGRKRAGVMVEVSRGAPKLIKNAFTMPLRAGAVAGGNGIGVFTRSKYGVVQHRYGPAVYQLFRVAAGNIEDSVGDKLERLGIVAAEALEKALS